MSEAELQDNIIEMAQTFGWLLEHKRPARLENGEWRTAIEGDKGGPDLLLARAGAFLVIECKSQSGKLSEEQKLWREAGVITWRPLEWLDGTIEKALSQ